MALKSISFYASLLQGQILPGVRTNTSHVLIYGAIEAHSRGPKGCIASNKLIGEETGLGPNTVANRISELNKAKWIYVDLDNSSHRLSITPLLELVNPSLYSEGTLHSGVNIDNSKRIATLSSETKEQINEVYRFYLKVFKLTDTQYRLTEKRSKSLSTRLREFSVSDLQDALTNAQKHDFYSGRNGKWDGFDLYWCTKSTENVEKMLNLKTGESEDEKLDRIRRGAGYKT